MGDGAALTGCMKLVTGCKDVIIFDSWPQDLFGTKITERSQCKQASFKLEKKEVFSTINEGWERGNRKVWIAATCSWNFLLCFRSEQIFGPNQKDARKTTRNLLENLLELHKPSLPLRTCLFIKSWRETENYERMERRTDVKEKKLDTNAFNFTVGWS